MSGMTGQPQPKVALDNVCSVVYNNTLYAYQASAFQSLRLESGAQWETLVQGESLSNAVCVSVTPPDESKAALFIVGGTGGSDGYKGLQKYTYSTGKWDSLSPVTSVTQNRINHGAVYLPGSDAIVVYAGSQEGDSNYSTQTFSINATEPHSVLAYESDGAPPSTKPTLLRWSDTQAVLFGGSDTNKQVMLFEAGTGWTNSGATLASPLKTGNNSWHATLVTGGDGSKSLYTYDVTVSPNVANRTVVVDKHGAPVTNAVAITKRWDGDDLIERSESSALTEDNWPSYNGTYASSATRNNSAAAESADGTVVVTGGNMDDVICIFNQSSNSWINATQLLVADSDQKTLHASVASSSGTASATGSSTIEATASAETTAGGAAASSSNAGSGPSSSSLSTDKILGVVLGSIGGAIVLLTLLYCQIKRRKRRLDYIQAGHARRASGDSREPEKEGMAITNDNFPRSPTNPTFLRGHQQKGSTASFSSMAILMGKGPKSSMDVSRQGVDNGKQLKSSIGNPMLAAEGPMPPVPALSPGTRDEKSVSFTANTAEPRTGLRVPDQQGATRRSSGWNRYWSGDSGALNILGYANGSRNTVTSEGSRYSTSGPANDPRNRRTQDSATVPPLHVDGRPHFSRVNSASPTVSHFSSGLPEGLSGKIGGNRPASVESDLSGYSSGIPPSVQENWDPTALSSRPWTGQRATSSMYSGYNFPAPPTPTDQRPPVPRNIPSGISQQPQLATAHTSDMSWLNLGEHQQNRY